MELLVGVLHHGHRHASRYIDALSLQSCSRVGDQFRLEDRVTPCLGNDLGELKAFSECINFTGKHEPIIIGFDAWVDVLER